MPIDVHRELAGIKATLPPERRPAAYQQLVRKLEAAKAHASHLPLKHRLSVCIHYVKAKAREDRAWS